MLIRKSDIAELSQTCAVFFGFIALTLAVYGFIAAFDLIPIGYPTFGTLCFSLLPVTIFLVGSFVLGAMFRNALIKDQFKVLRNPRPLRCDPLTENQISQPFKMRIEKFSPPAIAKGFVPAGAYRLTRALYTALLLHPDGHSVISLVHPSPSNSLEILSYLDDGSVISSSNTEDAVRTIAKSRRITIEEAETYLNDYPEIAEQLIFATESDTSSFGYLSNRYPSASIEQLIEAHEHTVQAVLTDAEIGLRKLAPQNCRNYFRYSLLHFDQIKFKLGKLDSAPLPCVFPAGALVQKNELVS